MTNQPPPKSANHARKHKIWSVVSCAKIVKQPIIAILKTCYLKAWQQPLKWKCIGESDRDNGERGSHCPLCGYFLRGLQCQTIEGIIAYIYHRSCLIRLALLYPIIRSCKASLVHSLPKLIIHWCRLNKPKLLKLKEWTVRQESLRKFLRNTLFFFFAFEYSNEFLENAKTVLCAVLCKEPFHTIDNNR